VEDYLKEIKERNIIKLEVFKRKMTRPIGSDLGSGNQ
jgi:hypothetical protein